MPMAKVERLRTKPERFKAQQGEALRQLVLDYGEALPRRAVGEILIAIDRNTEAEGGDWRFLLMGPEEFNAVADWLDEHSVCPRMAMRLFRNLFRFVDPRTQEILRTRDELAELVAADPDDVSKVMGELVRIGVLRRERVPVPGLRGPGMVRWYMNPTVATRLGGKARERAQAEAKALDLAPPKKDRKRPKLAPVE
jgi:hypothetical protein